MATPPTLTEDDRTISTEEAQRHFDAVLARATDDKLHVVLTRDGEPVAALIPIEALGLLDRVFEALEDEVDLREVHRIRAEGEESIPLDQAFGELGLEDEPEEERA